MAYDQQCVVITLEAAGDLSGSQYRFVKVSGAQQVNAISSATADRPIGILQNKPDLAGKASTIYVDGISKAVASAAIAAGALLTIDSVGRVATAATGNVVYAVALQAASATGDIISVIIKGLSTAP